MSHPPEGVLRRAIDEPAAMGDAERRHVAGCDRCRGELAAALADRDAVAVRLATEPCSGSELGSGPDADVDADVDAAWRRFAARVDDATAPAAGVVTALPAPRARRRGVRRPVVAVAVAAVVALGTTAAAAAADWL